MEHLGQGRPFILAGHSQGTMHLRKLLRRRISGTPLAQRMVAAYLIGGGVLLEELAQMPDLHACQSATDLQCVVHWETYGPDPRPVVLEEGKTLCTNPLSWQTDEAPAPARANLGAVPMSGFSIWSSAARTSRMKPASTPCKRRFRRTPERVARTASCSWRIRRERLSTAWLCPARTITGSTTRCST